MRDGAPTRERIDRKAMELFVSQGVSETTVRDIAGASGIAEGALYRHYRGKDELILALFERHYAAFAERLEGLQAARHGTLEKLRAMIAECARVFDADPVLFQFLLLVQHHSLHRIDGGRDTPVEVVRRVVAEGMAKGEIPKRDPDLAAGFVLGIIVQIATFKTYGRLPGPMAPLAESLSAACWRALQA